MTDSITVPIPDAVKDNNTHTVRVVSNGTRAEEGGVTAAQQLADYTGRFKETFGYVVYTWDDVNAQGDRVTLHRLLRDGNTAWLYETSYFTRVDCARCAYHWAQAYVAVEQDGQMTDPEPLCGDHIRMTESRITYAREAGIELTMYLSEWLRIGKH